MQPKYQRPITCEPCQLYRTGFGFAYPTGPANARLAFIGEALGGDEAIHGAPFIGAAGGVLTRSLTRAGIARDHVRIANVCSCQPPQNWLEGAPWEFSAIASCRQYLQPVLDALPDNAVVVPLGGTALRSVMNLHGVKGVSVKDWHGTVSRDPSNRLWVIPSFHPSHLQRGAMNLLEVQTSDFRLAERISREGFTRTPVDLIVDPALEWFRGWVDRHLARLAADPDATWLALDTEFPEKAAGQDESEVDVAASAQSPIIRYNVANSTREGVTVPNTDAYRAEVERLLVGIAAADGYVFYWNKYADVDHLLAADHTVGGANHIDLMWLCHYLQSDIPRGLGFWAPFASDFGPWKHWANDQATFGRYAAADAVQTYRIAVWAVKAAIASGAWDVFYRDWHERDLYVLRPSRAVGVPMNRAALEAFHADLQQKHAAVLAKIKTIGAQGTLKPKDGYARKPVLGVCGHCNGTGTPLLDAVIGTADLTNFCEPCGGTGEVVAPPPASLFGSTGKKKKSEAKLEYLSTGVQLVSREIIIDTRLCATCGALDVGPKHRCPKIKTRKGEPPAPLRMPALRVEPRPQTRWFWQVPFNPSSWQQVLAYITTQGHEAGKHRKTKQPTTDAASLKKLAATTGDPLYQLLLDGRAVEKVDGTYAVGTLTRLDADDRVHPEILPKPSTLRDSSSGPNLQNCLRRGTLIEIVRDCSQHPKGIAIEDVRVGDLAYTYDDAGALTLRPVTAVLDQGVRLLIRVHWRASRCTGRTGFVDMTADHLVRLASGEYIQAAQLRQWDRVYALGRGDDGQGYELIFPTGAKMIREHAFVYRTLTGEKAPHTHHINENKKDNRPENLQGIAVGEHFRHHNTGEGNPRWHAEWPIAPKERRKRAWQEYRARTRPLHHNHEIVTVEPLTYADHVYDLTIAETHNFIAGELCVHNCIADKDKKKSLAAGFRKCIQARPGRPPGVTDYQYDAWRDRWGISPSNDDLRCSLTEHDFSGIEAVLTGWCFWRHLGDSVGAKDYIRKCRLSLHAIVTAIRVGKPIDLNRPDDLIAKDVAAIKEQYPYDYDIIKHVNHGTHYALTPFGMCEMFPDHFKTPKEAAELQQYLFTAAPSLPIWQTAVRKRAKEVGYLGGLPAAGAPASIWDHPFGYKHWYWNVLTYKPCDEVTARKWLRDPARAGRIQSMHGRWFKIEWGEDSKRGCSFYPQSIGAGCLKRAELLLYGPDALTDDYIGDAYFGLTPLLHPVHDSLVNHLPNVIKDRVVATIARVMQAPITELPIPPEWHMGDYLRIGVEAKVGPTWDKADMQKVKVEPIVYGVDHPEDSPVIAREEEDMEMFEALAREVAS